ncbi:MAG: hypothetical protein LC792_16765 [Actinobacteria bacterium]|nr:hypothetical protein [Actinomycetota bacterium]
MRTSPEGRRIVSPAAFLRAAASLGRPWRALLVAVVALTALVPPAAAPPAVAAGGRPSGPLVPANGFYVGAYTKSVDGYGQEKAKAAMDDMESRLGRRLQIDHHFYGWTDVYPSWRESDDIENGRIPMISWNGENTDAIVRGDWDWMIVSRAQSVAALDTPVFIRWFWEMDGNKKQGFISSPASYQKAWRHIHDLFQQAGAKNAVWVWCPNAYWRVDTSPSAFEGFRFLFTGPAPEKPTDSPPSAAPPAPDPADSVVAATTPTTAARPPRTGAAPTAEAPDPGATDATDASSKSTHAATTRVPSPRLTWVLELLRQLDAASVAT